MKKACLFLFLGLTVFLSGLVIGVLIGRNVYGSNVTIQCQPQATAPATEAANNSAPELGFLVNVNSASAQILDTLPGIGPTLAQRIIAYRETNGPFHCKEDLLGVSGIGNEKLKAIYDLITVEDNDEDTGS